MKMPWKVVVVLVIAMLVVGQVMTLRALAAMSENLEGAHTALAAAQAALDKAGKDYQTMASHWNAMGKMSGMTAADKEMWKLVGESAATQKAMWDSSASALKSIEGIWKQAANQNK
jgi:Tfp pilus assembly protein PilX